MKYSLVAIAFAAAASAQRESIPECALPCLDDVVKAKTNCATDDYACICPKFEQLQGEATPCVLEKCSADVAINKLLPAVSKICANPGSAKPSSTGSASASASASAGTSSVTVTTTKTATTTGTTKPTSNPKPTTTESQVPTTTPTTGAAVSYGPLGALAIGALAFAL